MTNLRISRNRQRMELDADLNDPLSIIDGWEPLWGLPRSEPPLSPIEEDPVMARAAANVIPVAVFLQPLNPYTRLYHSVVDLQKQYYGGRNEEFFMGWMHVCDIMMDKRKKFLQLHLEEHIPRIRAALKGLLLSPEVSLLTTEAGNELKLYFCGDGYADEYIYDNTWDVYIHILSGVKEPSIFLSTEEDSLSETHIRDVLFPWNEASKKKYVGPGVPELPGAITHFMVLGARGGERREHTELFSLTHPKLKYESPYRGELNQRKIKTPQHVWVPWRSSLHLSRSNFSMLTGNQYRKLELIYPTMWEYVDDDGNLGDQEELKQPGKRVYRAGLWMRPPPYSIIAPMVFSSFSTVSPSSHLHFLVYSPYLNHAMIDDPPSRRYLQNAISKRTKIRFSKLLFRRFAEDPPVWHVPLLDEPPSITHGTLARRIVIGNDQSAEETSRLLPIYRPRSPQKFYSVTLSAPRMVDYERHGHQYAVIPLTSPLLVEKVKRRRLEKTLADRPEPPLRVVYRRDLDILRRKFPRSGIPPREEIERERELERIDRKAIELQRERENLDREVEALMEERNALLGLIKPFEGPSGESTDFPGKIGLSVPKTGKSAALDKSDADPLSEAALCKGLDKLTIHKTTDQIKKEPEEPEEHGTLEALQQGKSTRDAFLF